MRIERASLSRSNGTRRPSDFTTVSSRNCMRSKVVKRWPQFAQKRRRRIATRPRSGRQSFTCVSSWPQNGQRIRRRRFCANCGQRFTTIERVQLRELTVVKSDARRVPFDRDKLARSIRIALRKRPIQEERIERIVNGIVRQLESAARATSRASRSASW